MNWTTERPSVAGSYWFRNQLHIKPSVMRVTPPDDECPYTLWSESGVDEPSTYRYNKGDEWSDTPIPEPEEVKRVSINHEAIASMMVEGVPDTRVNKEEVSP